MSLSSLPKPDAEAAETKWVQVGRVGLCGREWAWEWQCEATLDGNAKGKRLRGV